MNNRRDASAVARPPVAARLFAWGGAAAFVLSLAYFAFRFLVDFGIAAADPAEASGGRVNPIAWNLALFAMFAAHHSVFARQRVRSWVTRLLPDGLERSFYVWVASVLFAIVCAWWQPVPGIAWRAEGTLLWVLRLLQAAGLLVILRSAAILDVYELAGVTVRAPEHGARIAAAAAPRAAATGAEPAGRRAQAQSSETAFRTAGPYGWIRHPIYAGWFLLVFPASPMTMTRLVFAIVSGVYLLLAIPWEERTLRGTSGGRYERYMRQVRWRLVPGVF